MAPRNFCCPPILREEGLSPGCSFLHFARERWSRWLLLRNWGTAFSCGERKCTRRWAEVPRVSSPDIRSIKEKPNSLWSWSGSEDGRMEVRMRLQLTGRTARRLRRRSIMQSVWKAWLTERRLVSADLINCVWNSKTIKVGYTAKVKSFRWWCYANV